MTFNRNLIAVVLLVLLAASLLISSLDYSGAIIGSGGGPAGSYSYTGNGETPMNHTPEPVGLAGGSPEKNGGNSTDPLANLGLIFGSQVDGNSSAAVQDSGNSLLIIGVIAAGMAIIAAVAFVILRKRRRRNAISTAALPTLPLSPPAPESFEGRYQLRFPRIREPFPLTWGTDEPLELAITCKDEATGEAMLSIDGEGPRKVLLENGMATVSLKPGKGKHRVTVSTMACVRPSGDSWVNVCIVDYREEIVRMFNEMCRRFSAWRTKGPGTS